MNTLNKIELEKITGGVAICIGGDSSGMIFMQQLAAEAGGVYIAK